ncbi:heme ABC transporter ATP-binding protein [Neokomagataea anthophila]|nr:heme ABC transporter ATP-binding protein [Neokomagataea anthophila]
MLCLKHVSCHVAERVLLNDISVTVSAGEIVAVVGKNGAGKSTLLKVASGLLRPAVGEVMLDGQCVYQLCAKELSKRRGMLMQETPMRASFTVEQVVGMGLMSCFLAQRIKIVDEQIARVGLTHLAQRDIMSLSGGERQRAHLARVLAQLKGGSEECNPGLLLLDEPIAAQDFSRQGLVFKLAKEHVSHGGGCLVVLHDLNWAAACADRIVMLLEGSIYAQGPPEDILTSKALLDVFDVKVTGVSTHCGTQKPFVIPHDLNS